MEFLSPSNETFKALKLHNSIKNMPGRGGASIVQVSKNYLKIIFSFLFSFNYYI